MEKIQTQVQQGQQALVVEHLVLLQVVEHQEILRQLVRLKVMMEV